MISGKVGMISGKVGMKSGRSAVFASKLTGVDWRRCCVSHGTYVCIRTVCARDCVRLVDLARFRGVWCVHTLLWRCVRPHV
jgi:hypothetical protein